MYIYCKTNEPDGTFFNAFYEDFGSAGTRMYSYAYGGYCVVMPEGRIHSLMEGDTIMLEMFRVAVERYENEQTV